MSIGYAYYCDGPDCDAHTDPIATPPPYLPFGFIEVREVEPMSEDKRQFCGWDCLTKFAAAKPLPERIELDDLPGGDGP